jgi:hypothetical protein
MATPSSVVASRADIWNDSDQFHFVYQPLNGDGEIIARIVSQTTADPSWTKGGIMIRESLAANARYAMAAISSANGIRMQWRTASGGASGDFNGGSGTPPTWLRLVHSGDQLLAYRSTDGTNWGRLSTLKQFRWPKTFTSVWQSPHILTRRQRKPYLTTSR